MLGADWLLPYEQPITTLMKRILLLSLFLAPAFTAFSQNNSFSIGLTTSIDRGVYDARSFEEEGNATKFSEPLLHNFSAGLRGQYNFGSRSFVRASVEYTSIGAQSEYANGPFSPGITQYNNREHFVSFSAFYGIHISLNERWKLTTSTGASVDYIFDRDSYYTTTEGETVMLPSFSGGRDAGGDPDIMLQLNFGAEYLLSERVYLGLEPYLTYSLWNYRSQAAPNDLAHGLILSANYRL
jgi:hypothetical protein